MTPDEPHRSDPGREQEEDLYKETSLHVCLRSAYHYISPHTATVGHHCGSFPHGNTQGELWAIYSLPSPLFVVDIIHKTSGFNCSPFFVGLQ